MDFNIPAPAAPAQPSTPTPTAPPAAPAAPAAAPPTVSAARDAANRGSFSDFEKAHVAQRAHKPLADVPATDPAVAAQPVVRTSDSTPPATPPAPAQPDAATLSNRQRKANEAVQDAVNRAHGDLIAENARLRAQLGPRRDPLAPIDPAAPAPPLTPDQQRVARAAEYKRFLAMPDAPKIAEFDSLEEHSAAMALFVADKRHDERTADAAARTESDRVSSHEHQQITSFDERVTALAKDDPTIVDTIAPVAAALAERGGPFRTVSSLVLASPVGPQILRLIRQTPTALQALVTPPAHLRGLSGAAFARAHVQHVIKEFGKLEASLEAPASAAPAVPAAAPSTISAAPPPPPTLTRAGSTPDPKSAALARGDFATFEKLDRQERLAKRGIAVSA